MIGHVLRLVWNRRRENGLIIAELFVSFLILCGLFTVGADYVLNWRQPLGFDYHDVWHARLSYGPYHQFDEERQQSVRRTLAELERAVAEHPGVVAASVTVNVPYVRSRRVTSRRIDGELVRVLTTDTRPALLDVLRYDVVEGRWYRPGDETLAGRHVVITEGLAREWFGDEPTPGQLVPHFDLDVRAEDVPEEERLRVLGVVRNPKTDGEQQEAPEQFFHLYDANDPDAYPPRHLLIRVAPGAGASVESELFSLVERVAPEFTFTLTRLESERRSYLRAAITPLVILGVVAGFLVTMVGLGLIGVLWQSVTRRRNEIGLRRALGSTAAGTRGQILGELVALTSLAVACGMVVFVQLPLLGLFDAAWPAVAMAVGAALAVVFAVVLACGFYPSWLASRVQPAASLMYE
jgi:putative ABC transport system permease protein